MNTHDPSQFSASALDAARLPPEAERLATAIVASQLRGLFADAENACNPADAIATLRPSHARWLEATLRHLERHGLLSSDAQTQRSRFAEVEPVETLWQRWDEAMRVWAGNVNHRAYLALIEACLRKLPEILTGAVPATDVMFPESSMHLVEGIYKHNLIADHFNLVLGESLRDELAAKTARGERGLRLLEIGAGTGGTTTALLPTLRGFSDRIDEYCYTDLSKAFLLHAEEVYQPQFPAIRTAIFDVGKPLAQQSVEGNRYDAVIATNVLHATSNMRETVRNAKALLKRGGVLLVNELSEWAWYTHFTFGLLEGWWLYEDESLRLPGCPCLSPKQWENLLKVERFHDIRFPASAHHGLGQLVLAARSDGVVRQRLVPPVAAAKAPAPNRASVAATPAVHAAAAQASPVEPAPAPAVAASAATGDAWLANACASLFREMIAAALRMDVREIETSRPLEQYGLDSILVVQLTTHFRKLFPGVRSTLFFEVQSIDGLVRHFLDNDRATVESVLAARGIVPATAAATPPVAAPAPVVASAAATSLTAPAPRVQRERRRFAPRHEAAPPVPATASPTASPASSDTTAGRPGRFDVAIIGISGRYPQSPDLERFWENLSAGRDCAGEVPADRWHWQDHYDPEKGPGFTRWGGFIDDVDKFDPLFFRIAPKEAKKIDPQERLFLETSYHAIEDSGYTPDTLAPNGKVGVFVGVMNSRYTPQPLFYSIANRISFLFDFSGPSFAVDSACSASLTAIHVALDSLYSGMCEAAIAGGVSLILDPQHMLELTALGMLSEGGKCRSFGTNADGFLDAEGVGAVILKPLANALRDGDHIHAVIKGSALNAGGRTHGYTVPNPVAQAAVVSAALTRADIDSADVSYLEAHGTGTALGDPIEVAGLTRAFRANRRATDRATGQHCAIGSLKSNIGHCESAAGIAALTKVLLQLRHRQLVPTLHAEQVNEEIDFSTTPFRLQRELAAWRAPLDGATGRELPRIAGISSFGAGGANAHLVVQEAPVSARPRAAVAGPRLVPLSARNAEQLQDKIRQLLAYLRREGANVDLEALAYTLQVGREAMDERIALIVDSADDLRRQLQALADGQRPDHEPQRGNVRKNREFLAACRADPDFASRCEAWTAQRDLARIAEHWAKGVGIDWAQLHAGAEARPGRIPLPTYPFARDRHWIEPQRSLGHGQAAAVKHPLLQRNTSTLRYPAYAVELKGDERFLGTDATGQRHLPALLCLEMARAAVAEAYPDDIAARELRFEGVALDDGLRIDAGCELQIALLPDSDDALRFEIHSALGDAERVHAQGRALFVAPAASAQVDVAAFAARLSRGISTDAFHGRFPTLGLADATEHRVVRRVARSARELVLEYAGTETTTSGPWGLPPDVLAAVIQGAAWLLGELGPLPSAPFAWRIPAIDAVRFHGQCAQQGYLVLRCEEQAAADAETTRWDATCFDANGHPTLDIAGLRLSRLPVAQGTAPVVTAAAVVTAVAATPVAASRPSETAATETRLPAPVLPEAGRKLAFLRATASADRAPVATDRPHAKPPTLILPAAADLPGPGPVPTARPTIALHRPDAEVVAVADADAAASCVDLRDLGDGVYSLTVEADAPTAAAIDQLMQALTHLRDRADAKALLIAGGENAFRRGDAAALDAAIATGLYRALLDFPLPTIAAPQGDADGGGFLLAALCDFMVCAEESRYGFSDPGHGFHPSTAEADLLAVRFGASRANDLLYVSGAQSGQALAAKGWTMPVVQRAKTLSTALALAASIAAKPRESLALLKTHMADALAPLVARLGSAPRPQSGPVAPSKAAGKPPKARAGIAIEPLSDTVVSVRLRTGHATRSAALRDLRATLTDLAQRGGHAAIVLRSDLPDFLPASGDGDARASAAELVSLQATLSGLPVPLVVAFEHDTDGFGWLLGLSADACVHGERGRCSAEALWRDSALLRQAMPVFARRLGDNLARTCLFGATAIDAAALAAGAAIVASDVLATTLALLDATPLRSADALRQWRQRNHAADTAEEVVPTGERRAAPLPSSPAIETEVRDNGVIVVRMVDRDAKNMYSPALIRGLEEVFAHIDGCDDYRAVVLTGYDTYFACGGTREGLLAIQQGAAKFTDAKVYQLPMSCRLPVIAAMQGHAIGGGWTLGMFADLCLFSAESRYISPYMQYGFTPGAGSTLIFPARLGADLAKETLFTAHEYTGSELRAKGLPHVCVPRSEVLPRALALADAIAARSADDVLAMKRHFSAADLAQVEATYARELAMHDRSFVGQSHALQGVMQHFLDDGDGSGDVAPVQAQSAPIAAATPAATDVPEPVDADGIADFLKSLLAFELQLRADDVDEDTQFVDLGLDSITGVTWVRKINAEYGTKIEATKVYSHPTLRQFRDFVVALIAARRGASKPAPSASRAVAAVAPQVVAAADAFAPQVAATAAASAPQVAANETRDSEADLCAALKRLLAQELHMSEDDVDEDRQFVELGLDSITGVTWVRKINAEYGTKIEATKVYSHPTLVEFSRFLRGLLPKQAVAPAPAAPAVARVAPASAPTHPAATTAIASRTQPATQSLTSWRKQGARRASSAARGDDAIAVIGIAGQFPRAKTLDAFWRNIAGAKECIDLVPPQRFDIERFFNEDISVPGTTNSRWMGVLEDCDVFDPLFFNISPIEAECMDPQQRLMLQTCWHAIENAAIDPRSLSGSRCGVFVGCGATDYHQRSREHELSSQGFTGAAMSILAARIAYFLNLQGPCLSIDTACSSSLVAIANACDSLVAQNCDLALAGGVAVMAGPAMHVKNAQSGMLSPDGRCFAFDHRANGFVPGEGVGTVLLKRLTDAERDGDIVHAVIRGWGVNQDGKTNGITAPNPVSQTRLMRAVYDRFGIDPEDIQLVEAHGTGTELGDPIEVEGLTEAFRHYTDKTQYCALGSVKGNIGHSLYAAGVAGVLKLVLALKHRQLPPAASFERLNPHIDLSDSPFHVNTALQPWPENARGGRAAVVSSFGFSGTNAHLVLEAAPLRATADAGPSRPALIPLSAKTPEQLRQRAHDLAEFLEAAAAHADAAPSLQDIAYTLQVGKEAMEERCALVARSLTELDDRLRAFAAGETPKGMHVGSSLSRAGKLAFIGQDRDLQAVLIQTCLREGKLDKLAELWVDGVDLPWDTLHRDATGARPRRIELPLYPFAREHYWLEDERSAPGFNGAGAATVLHPLLHANVSTLRQQRYRTTFDGSEFFLRDHRVRFGEGRIEHVLPGVAYLEMAAAAVADALPDGFADAGSHERLVLSNVAWWRPVVVDGPTTVEIELGIDDAGAVVFEIASGSGEGRVVHCQGEAGFVDAVGERMVDAALLAAAPRGEQWEGDDIYAAFGPMGLHYGPAHRGLRTLSRTGGKLVAAVELPAVAGGPEAYRMHPSVMDSALQACIGFLPSLQALPHAPSVPFALRSLTLHAPCPAEAIVVLSPTGAVGAGPVENCDVSIFDADGTLCVDIRGFVWRGVDKAKAATVAGTAETHGSDAAHAPASRDEAGTFDEAFYRELLDSISRKEMSAEKAAELGLLS
jgi:acyl transferase domain-containing protein/enoyl-CoA hydratase/carnithine racemase/aryl carrier-like protein/SAM-dependent methyltransferase